MNEDELARGNAWNRCTPGVSREWLFLVAGTVWTGVGAALSIVSIYWLSRLTWPTGGIGALLGFGIGFTVYRFGFSRIAAKNIDRIATKPERVCFFAFQAWRSYFLIVFMVMLGYSLRHYSHLPKVIIAVIYLTIGTALALSSSLYYEKFL
jgi:hypothetical protein